MSGTLVELCAGTASLSLWALGRLPPLTGYMGSKRRMAPLLVDALGCDRPDRVVLVDAGPWGDVWATLADPWRRAVVVELLLGWQEIDRAKLWADLTSRPPPADAPASRVAQYLWLQARSAGTIPVWWSEERGRWESPTGARTEAAHNRGGADLRRRQKGAAAAIPQSREEARPYEAGGLERRRAERGEPQKGYGCRGIQNPATIARRIADLEALPWDRITVVHGDCRAVEPIPGSVVYLDPPYLGCPRYAALLPRADVLALAQRWHAGDARVAVSEAEPLDLDGWTSMSVPARKPEWITASWPIVVPEQLALWGAA